ncbi:hypothetical protein WR25_26656 isoform B [Diploscapter pachys]|nr:hypothetical protein WR25_26656 isoform B [Diploscapter pachys]
MRLAVRSLIAEGGFAVVLGAQDSKGTWFAIKRQLASDEQMKMAVIQEIRIMKELSGHPSIIRFVQAAQMKGERGGTEFMIVMELCTGGSVADLIKSNSLSIPQITKIFYSATRAVQHMQERQPPITHRDIKLENLLFNAQGFVKLCDFGSATIEQFYPDDSWNSSKRTYLEEEMQRHTTPMYRAPEILDTYQNFAVGVQQDIWALGCVLYFLCTGVHPFQDSAKLAILNVKYSIPAVMREGPNSYFLPLIESCLVADPPLRPRIDDLVERIEVLAVALGIDLAQPVEGLQRETRPANPADAARAANPRASSPSQPSSKKEGDVSQQAAAMFGAIKGQGLSLLKNIKDKSAAVVHSVQTNLSATAGSGEPELRDAAPIPPKRHESRTERERANLNVSPVQPPAKDPIAPPRHVQSKSPSQTQPLAQPQPQTDPFFDSLDWGNAPTAPVSTTTVNSNAGNVASSDLFDPFGENQQASAATRQQQQQQRKPESKLTAEDYERMAGIRVSNAVEDDDADEFKFDYEKSTLSSEKETPILQAGSGSPINQNNIDLLLINENEQVRPAASSAQNVDLLNDLFGYGGATATPAHKVTSQTELKTNDLLTDWTTNVKESTMHRNASAPTFHGSSSSAAKPAAFDPFAEFLAANPDKPQQTSQKGNDKVPQAKQPPKPNYNRSAFEDLQKPKTKLTSSTFDDLLSSQGFTSTSRSNANRTLGSMQREEEVKYLDPIQIKIRDWTKGKERNIRALLGSLNDALWEGAEKWQQPSIGDLLTPAQVKKFYRKACLVVHPDKQGGQPHEELARAIFTELNDAYTAFETAGCPSI